jgi:hypothetical protein
MHSKHRLLMKQKLVPGTLSSPSLPSAGERAGERRRICSGTSNDRSEDFKRTPLASFARRNGNEGFGVARAALLPAITAFIAIMAAGLCTITPAGAANTNFNDYLLVPLRVHLLTVTDTPELTTTLANKDIDRILKKMNGIWSQAGIHFYLESLLHEEAPHPEAPAADTTPHENGLLGLRPKESRSEDCFHIYYIKQMPMNGIYLGEAIFVKDTARLREVEGGIDEPLPRVTSHELGHALSLEHLQNTTNLMASGTTGTWLNDAEIKQSRSTAAKLVWIKSAPAVLGEAEDLYREKKFNEARVLYQRLTPLPVNSPEVQRARNRAKE